MNKFNLRQGDLPCWHPADGRTQCPRATASLIKRYDGRLHRYRSLPVPAQLALAWFMAIDGETWPELPGKCTEPFGTSAASIQTHQRLRRYLPRYVKKFGNRCFGLVSVPLTPLVHAYRRGINEKQSTAKYIADCVAGYEDEKPDRQIWPVILNSFPIDDPELGGLLQDGNNRFHRYCGRQLDRIPCLWFPASEADWLEGDDHWETKKVVQLT